MAVSYTHLDVYKRQTEGIIRSEISNAKIRDAKIIMDHIRQAIQSRKAELDVYKRQLHGCA